MINLTNKIKYRFDKVFKICDLREVNLHCGELPQIVRPGKTIV